MTDNDKQKALDGEMGKQLNLNLGDDSSPELDKSFENEGNRDYSPMVQISLKEYDKLKEKQHFITDKALIDIIDNMERLERALRKHIVRTDI